MGNLRHTLVTFAVEVEDSRDVRICKVGESLIELGDICALEYGVVRSLGEGIGCGGWPEVTGQTVGVVSEFVWVLAHGVGDVGANRTKWNCPIGKRSACHAASPSMFKAV